MKDIDVMDMLGFLRLRAWDATRKQEKKNPGSASLTKSVRRWSLDDADRLDNERKEEMEHVS